MLRDPITNARHVRTWTLAIAVATGVAGPVSAQQQQPQGQRPSAVTCDIKVGGSGGAITFQGEIKSGYITGGEFHLTAFRLTPGGSFRMNQANTFQVGPGAPALLGFITLSGTGGTYTAELLIRYDNGTGSCVKQVSGQAQ